MNRSPWIARLLALAACALLAACAGRDGGTRASIVEREGQHGTLRYRLTSEIRPARVTLGDRAIWRLKADLPAGAHPGAPWIEPDHPSLDVDLLDRSGGRGAWTASYRVSAFDLGHQPLPALRLPVQWPDGADTLVFPPDTLTVDSLTTASTDSLEPDRGPVRPELRPIDIVVVVLGALLLAALVVAAIVWLRRRRRARRPAAAEAPPEPPEAPFLRALETLRAEADTLPRDRFYDRLSLAVRAYVAAVTGIPALDRTTSELLRELEGRADVRRDALEPLARALRASDLAKFARLEDRREETRRALEDATWLAGALVQAPTTAAAPAGGD